MKPQTPAVPKIKAVTNLKEVKHMGISNPFAIITGIPEEFGGTLVIASAECNETYEGDVTITGKLLLRAPDLDSAANLVKQAQDAITRRKQ